MNKLSLNGSWTLYQEGDTAPIPAWVPGCVHTDLLDAGRIEDPYYRDNELDTLWICETDWAYKRTFDVPAALLEHDRVLLRCNGLDTLATVTVNGTIVGNTANMFRTWEFDVKEILIAGENSIEVAFDAPLPYVQKRNAERFLPAWGVGDHKLDSGGWIRKEPCNFGWDWGPMLTTSGIWRDIELVGFSTARLSDIHIRQGHDTAGHVDLAADISVEKTNESVLSAEVVVTLRREVIATQTVEMSSDEVVSALVIEEPQLWWPNGMGDQPLYDVEVTLSNADGDVLDTWTRRIGLRTLVLERKPDEWGESFHFAVNGLPFFAKGANWIPADTFSTRLTEDDYARLIGDAVAANMNMLRVWGGGIYEDDIFYDLCDELGICVWQDFMFGCATYPAFDATYMANVKAEAEDNVRRIRHHACLALWCGNNELEQGLVGDEWTETTMSWEDYDKLYNVLLPEVVARLDPQRDYWPCSPHTPVGDRRDFNNPDSGDAHLWSVWHGKEPFEWYRGCTHRFNSEFGFQSFPEPQTVYTYTSPEDRNITSFVMEHHQRSGIGNSTIIHYMLDWFKLPTSFDMTLWLSQILQGMAIKYAVEHWRRGMPRGMGTLYWQLNDCWQVASWSSIDYFGNWKALHYMARDFFAPLLISGLEDSDQETVEIHVTSDLLEVTEGVAGWTLTDTDGNTLDQGSTKVHAGSRQNTLVETLDLSHWIESRDIRNLLLWLDLSVDGQTVSRNFVNFARPKHLNLVEPDIEVEFGEPGGGCYSVSLTTDVPALWTWLEFKGGAKFSNNFVHLRPGVNETIIIEPKEEMDVFDFSERLTIRSLADTYR